MKPLRSLLLSLALLGFSAHAEDPLINQQRAQALFNALFNGQPPTLAGMGITNGAAIDGAQTSLNNSAARYTTILQSAGSHIAAKAAGTYALGLGDPLAVSGTGTLYPIGLIAIRSADYPTINGLAPKLRVSGIVKCNATAPTGNFTLGLYPVTAGGGAAGLSIYTLGAVVAGSNGATVSAPAANSMTSIVGSDFALPADGIYCLAVVTTATVATAAHVHINAVLQQRNN